MSRATEPSRVRWNKSLADTAAERINLLGSGGRAAVATLFMRIEDGGSGGLLGQTPESEEEE